MHIFDIITDLRATSSKLEKERILLQHKDNSELREFFRLALNPYIRFYYKKKLVRDPMNAGELVTLQNAFEFLESTIASRRITGRAAATAIQSLVDSASDQTAEIIKRILKKDPDCGVDTLAEKIWPGIAPEYPVLLASPYKKKHVDKYIDFKKNPFVQLKSDGLRCNIAVDVDSQGEGTVAVFTRSGREMEVFGRFDHFMQYCADGISRVFDGELLTVKSDGEFNDRKTSNGICSKAVKGTMSQEEADSLHIVLWDVIPMTDFNAGAGSTPYDQRFDQLCSLIKKTPTHSIIPSKRVSSLEEVMTFFEEMRALGEEGVMLKCPTMLWESARSKYQYKMKAEDTADLKVVGFIEGEGKLEGNLGALTVETACGKCQVNISGFSLKERSEIYANLIGKPVEYETINGNVRTTHVANPGDSRVTIGSIVEVMYNEKILARDSNVWSLFLPRFVQARLDKTVASTLEEL